MEIDEEDENSSGMPNLAYMSREEINRVILGSDLDWDDNDLDTEGSERKRLRGDSSPEEDETALEGFTEVTRRKKKINQRSSPARGFTQRNPTLQEKGEAEPFVEVSVSSKECLPKKIGMARILKNCKVTGVLKVTYKSPYKILIRFKDSESAGTLMGCVQLVDAGWTCRKTNEVAHTYGVVKDIDLDIDDDQLKNEFQCDMEITNAKRLNKRDKDGKWVQSETVRLQFSGSDLPPYVFSYGLRIQVEPYIFPVTQCSKCWKFGHIRNFCPSNKQICPKCGSDHENCESTKYKCSNCKGDHMSVVKSLCPAFHREKKIREMMAEERCTYKVALLKIRQASEYEEERWENEEILVSPQSQAKTFADAVKEKQELKTVNVNKPASRKTPKGKEITKTLKHKDTAGPSFEKDNINPPSYRNNEEDSNGDIPKRHTYKDLFRRFLNKMKEIILAKEDWGEKIQMFVKYIVEEIKLLLKEYMNVDALLSFFNFTWDGLST